MRPTPDVPETAPVGAVVRPAGSALEVLLVFLRLGLTSFGGPVAHLGYFRTAFVQRRKWLDEAGFADLVGLCQFLPGPASSQVGFAIGLMRAGWAGGLAAWTGFTLPSALLMLLFAYGAGALHGPVGEGLVHGLKLTAVAIVAQAVVGMARTLAPDRTRALMAVAAGLFVLASGWALAQIVAIAAGAALGLLVCRSAPVRTEGRIATPFGRPVGALALMAFAGLLLLLPFAASASGSKTLALFDAFYRSGALVFGGGHVVLPLLREKVVKPGWVGEGAFLAGYGAAQAVPGPLFSFSAYLGAVASAGPGGLVGAALGLAGLFLPGLLVLVGVLPFWDSLRRIGSAQAAMRGVNATVVGILAAALYHPVWTSAVRTLPDVGLALAAFLLLVIWRVPPIVAVLLCATSGVLTALW